MEQNTNNISKLSMPGPHPGPHGPHPGGPHGPHGPHPGPRGPRIFKAEKYVDADKIKNKIKIYS